MKSRAASVMLALDSIPSESQDDGVRAQGRPLCIDLFCGLGGWSDGFLAEGYQCIGFDIERHDYGSGGYPGQLVLQDILTVHGSQFRDATCIVASPPCQKYSYMAMPWKRAKALIAWHRESAERVKALDALFDACFRIQYEACESAGRYIPLVVENVKGAQPWVGRAKWHYGSYYLWGDVPALMPITLRTVKVEGMNFHEHEKTGQPGRSFQTAAVEHTKNEGGSWFAQAHNTESGHSRNPVSDWRVRAEAGVKCAGSKHGEEYAMTRGSVSGIKQQGSGAEWFDNGLCKKSSRSDSRKAASAQIAKIPFPLAQHIARCFKPQ